MRRRNKPDQEESERIVQGECDFYIGKFEEVEQSDSMECQKLYLDNELYGMLFQYRGSGVHNIDCKKYELTGNTVSFLSPGQIHSFDFQNSEGYLLKFNSNIFQKDLSNRKLYDYPFFHTTLSSLIMDLPDEFPCLIFLLESMYKEFKQSCLKKRRASESVIGIVAD